MTIYQEAHLKQSILFSQNLFSDDELQNSIGVVEPDIICMSLGRRHIGNQVVGVENIDRPRIAEARKTLTFSCENGKQFMIEDSKRRKGFR